MKVRKLIMVLGMMVLMSQGAWAQFKITSVVLCDDGEVMRVAIPTNDDECVENWVEPRKAQVDEDTEKRYKRFPFSGCWTLERELKQGRTVLHCYVNAGKDVLENFWLGGEDTYIVDTDTGTRYKARGSYSPKLWNQNCCIKTKRGTLLDFPIYFPPLPLSVKNIKIYGVPAWNLRGRSIKLPFSENKATYDTVPKLRVPRLERPAHNYNKDDMDTYAWYGDAHLLAPMPEHTMALWRTPEATYLAIAYELNWAQEYYGFQPGDVLIDNSTGKQYKLRKVQGLPMKEMFFIHGVSGDMFAMVLEFDPLPLSATNIDYIQADAEPFYVWGANWYGTHYTNLPVPILIENQKKFNYYERVVVE